jgi:hypothetical protein
VLQADRPPPLLLLGPEADIGDSVLNSLALRQNCQQITLLIVTVWGATMAIVRAAG